MTCAAGKLSAKTSVARGQASMPPAIAAPAAAAPRLLPPTPLNISNARIMPAHDGTLKV